MTRYQAFGLSFASHQLPLPELPPAPAPGVNPEIPISEEDPTLWPRLPEATDGEKDLRMTPGELRLDVEDVGRFWVSQGRRIVWSRWSEMIPDQDIRSYLLGSAIGALLIQRGMLVLHGNALAHGGAAIVCLGESGAGKSTLAYALMQQGWELLADDLVAVTPAGHVLPGIPRIKLWHDAATAYGLDPANLTRVQVGIDKFQLTGQSILSRRQALPLKVLYALPDSPPHEREQGVPITLSTETSQQEAVRTLINHSFRPHFVRGLGRESANFLAIASLVRRIPLVRLGIPRGLDTLSAQLAGCNLLDP
jgi:hypothetical protein